MSSEARGASSSYRAGFKLVALVLLATQLSGCMRMRTLETPGPYVEARRPGRLWITIQRGPELVIESPRVIQDTVFGFNMAGAPVTFALSQLESVKAKELWMGPTLALAGLGAAVVVAVAALVAGGIDRNGGMTEETEDAVVPIF